MSSNRPLKVGDVVEILSADHDACEFAKACIGRQTTVTKLTVESGALMYQVDIRCPLEGLCDGFGYRRHQLRLIGDRPECSTMDELRSLGLFNDEWVNEHANA